MSGQSRGWVVSFGTGLRAVGLRRSADAWAENGQLSAAAVLNREKDHSLCEREAGIDTHFQKQLLLLGEWSGLQVDS